MALGGRRFRRRKKEVIFAEGYFLDHATDCLPQFDRNQEVFNLFGLESPEVDVQHVTGTLQITLLDKYTNNYLLDLLTAQDPTQVGVREYNVDRLDSIDVWANVKNQLNTAYIKSWYVPSWSAGMPVPSGDANSKAQFVVQGPSGLARSFEGAWIDAAKVASGTPSLGATPVAIPQSDPVVSAVAIRAIDDTVTPYVMENIQPSAAMVDTAGVVDFTEIQAAVTVPGLVLKKAYVLFLQTGSGVYPSVAPEGLYD